MRPRATRLLLVAALSGATTLACGDDASMTGSGGQGSADASSDGGAGGLPPACSADESPFLQEECLGQMREACNAQLDEHGCWASAPFAFYGYTVRCAWAKVVSFDGEQCSSPIVSGRCEAALDSNCGSYCAGSTMFSDMAAIPATGELIQMCGGPLGTWTALDNSEQHSFDCGVENLSSEVRPICDCADVACNAE
jgi:hypothetical protein